MFGIFSFLSYLCDVKDLESYGLDIQRTMILEEYREALPVFEKIQEVVKSVLTECLAKNKILVTAIESRIKSEESLAGKLQLKGYKYNFLSDLTDIVGARVITFYTEDVDKISALIESMFSIDWQNSDASTRQFWIPVIALHLPHTRVALLRRSHATDQRAAHRNSDAHGFATRVGKHVSRHWLQDEHRSSDRISAYTQQIGRHA